jgi:hypothetical protein
MAMTSFTAKHQVLMIGGFSHGQLLGDAWIWDGSDWSAIPGPGPRTEATAVDAGNQILLFGGADTTSMVTGTTTWDGATWTSS